ncbi:MAG: tetratricopeptide repeat protein [Candidatus Babeliales bacterium]|nr:tetratricopeptide repeat protein [Candidatus Babeliales bacterium]
MKAKFYLLIFLLTTFGYNQSKVAEKKSDSKTQVKSQKEKASDKEDLAKQIQGVLKIFHDTIANPKTSFKQKLNAAISMVAVNCSIGNCANALASYKKILEFNNRMPKPDPEITAAVDFGIGTIYQNGMGVKQDLAQAKKYFQQVLDNPQSNKELISGAHAALAVMSYAGKGADKDHTKSLEYFKEIINNKKSRPDMLSIAQGNLAIMYFKGQGVKRDIKEAIKYFTDVTENRGAIPVILATAQGTLANLYYAGRHVKKDYNKAEKYYKGLTQNPKAIAFQVAQAYFHLATIHKIKKDLKKADEYYLKADKEFTHVVTKNVDIPKNISDANFFLGIMNYKGFGVAENKQKAVEYLKKVTKDNSRTYSYAQKLINEAHNSKAKKISKLDGSKIKKTTKPKKQVAVKHKEVKHEKK